MTFNQAGFQILKEFEGCRLLSYQDQAGIWSVGFGCAHHVRPGMQITQKEADERLWEDVEYTAGRVRDLVLPQQIGDNQFSACVCLAYNIGVGSFAKSTLLNFIKSGHVMNAAGEFIRWDKVAGVPSDGLLRRRLAEQALFQS